MLPQQAIERLRGQCALIVEDEYFIATDLARGFEKAGISIAGPVPTLAKATELAESRRIDMAVLDISLDGDKVYSVADLLIARGVPIVFVTGYDASVIPPRFSGVPHCIKPASVEQVIGALESIFSG
ncbi:response regulator [Sphingomonas panaciterrae]|uniref:response regulator n=1 Tax=Sphingomonas panaciterrae TaxID=1462999 RepID=UPI002FF3EB69